MFNPVSTYRIQFHKEFTFKDFKNIIPYLHQLGVSTLYASPIFEATPGSNHGYDIVNPHRINPEIGTLEELQEINATLKTLQINLVQDIVPNHMAFHPGNAWLMDVLENGTESPYAEYFDRWDNDAAATNRIMVPFLGSPLKDVIEQGQLNVAYKSQKFSFCYGDQVYPLNKRSVARLLNKNSLGSPKDEAEVDKLLEAVNQNKELLQQIADDQYYELCNWQDTDSRINYRRFFTVNGLICLNMQKDVVFDEYHRFIKQLLDDGLFQGLRIDHVDGLYDPKTYLDKLRALVGKDTYIVVEKILESGEDLPAGWPVQGTTGYDFLGIVNNLFTNAGSRGKFNAFYRELAGPATPVSKAIPQKKAGILYQHMAGELDNLCRLFVNFNLSKVNPDDLKETIAEFLIRCPVYRFYGNQFPLSRDEVKSVKEILSSISRDKPGLKRVVSLLTGLLTRPQADELQPQVLHFYQRCMQLSGPLMAKGVEDTLMYTYDRFIGHNEVGDSPDQFGLKVTAFHELMQHRAQHWPMALNGTSTHDTKRGEDVRARLNVLTDLPDDWVTLVKKWTSVYNKFKTAGAPDSNDEYLIYQTLAGITPLPGQPDDNMAERLQAYLTKALREAKVHTNWAEPNEAYEDATCKFAEALLADNAFNKELAGWQQKTADHFIVNSLSQVLLKFTCPGIPDIYQGCDLWDFSLVDPDNRRPVDYDIRSEMLDDLQGMEPAALWARRYDGSVKLWLTNKLLHARRAHADLFASGSYVPLQVSGKYKNQVLAFARRHNRQWLLTVVPLHQAQIDNVDLAAIDWEDTTVLLPEDAPLKWSSALTGDKNIFSDSIAVKRLFGTLTFGLWLSDKAPAKRSAGVIMHITSLPSPYGVGDIGPAARQFADFSADAYQQYWQLLPVNPTSAATGFSPYSAFSAMAGNTLLISPDDLVDNGLLTAEEVAKVQARAATQTDYNYARQIKTRLFDVAFDRFETQKNVLAREFEDFKKSEKHWLEDFVLYAITKDTQKEKPWYEWPDKLKNRDPQALEDLRNKHSNDLEKERWLQFIFSRQWKTLRSYCQGKGINLLGDLSFYISYDSVDVWSNPTLFELDEKKNIKAVAGVPPDYFNADGQLWGMPVYNWQEHKDTGYRWWTDRVKRNLAFFDKIRLDHFRAFIDFWSVPAADKTAAGGKWLPGPGVAIFDALKKELGTFPFIAEDLGEISEGVYQLRDKLQLPGMNVLQFAFGDDMPVSVHIPHNHIPNSVSYTGTHDNNTTLGWFKEDSTPEQRKQLSAYLRTKVNAGNVNRLMNELCYSSAAGIAILPMQDVLHLGSNTRMNVPSLPEGNWLWRIEKHPGEKVAVDLRMMVLQFNR